MDPSPRKRLRLLFCLLHEGHLRNFEHVVRELAARGHELELVFDHPSDRWRSGRQLAAAIAGTFPNVRLVEAPGREDERRAGLARRIRLGLDYLRYVRPEFAHAPRLRRRGARDAPPALRLLVDHARFVRRPLERWLTGYEAGLPTDPAVERFLQERAPDLLLISPLLGLGSDQADYVWSAARLDIPTTLLVASWDNLTNKGTIRAPIALVAVWNEAQRREAVQLHGRDPSTVVATGAHSYDHWFAWQPSTTYEEFCRKVGLPGDRPFLLYVCSSLFIAPLERPFVLQWAQRIRNAATPLRDVSILVRPHPQNAEQWNDLEEDLPDAFAVFPFGGEIPVLEQARRDYFDSIHHSLAVVGVNTSAQIESAIVGRPVFTVSTEEWRESQTGTLHYAHLAGGAAPLLVESRSLDEHVKQLGALWSDASSDPTIRNRRFLETFVRPHGLDRPAAPLLADAIERAAALRVPDSFASAGTPSALVRFVSRPLLTDRRTLRRPVLLASWLLHGGWRRILRGPVRRRSHDGPVATVGSTTPSATSRSARSKSSG